MNGINLKLNIPIKKRNYHSLLVVWNISFLQHTKAQEICYLLTSNIRMNDYHLIYNDRWNKPLLSIHIVRIVYAIPISILTDFLPFFLFSFFDVMTSLSEIHMLKVIFNVLSRLSQWCIRVYTIYYICSTFYIWKKSNNKINKNLSITINQKLKINNISKIWGTHQSFF